MLVTLPPRPHLRSPAARSSRRRPPSTPPISVISAGDDVCSGQPESALRPASTWSYRAPNTPSDSAVFPRIMIALKGRENAKSTSTAPRSAPVALVDRRDGAWR
ncbi:hypothetical protein FB107DRAFT_270690 [Schizophyllum commune]